MFINNKKYNLAEIVFVEPNIISIDKEHYVNFEIHIQLRSINEIQIYSQRIMKIEENRCKKIKEEIKNEMYWNNNSNKVMQKLSIEAIDNKITLGIINYIKELEHLVTAGYISTRNYKFFRDIKLLNTEI